MARDSRKKELPILTELSREEYCKVWSQFDSDMFKFKMSVFEVPRKEFCYAGSWSYSMNLGTGELFQCYCGDKLMNIYDDISAPIKKRSIGRCREPHCFNAHAWLTFGDILELKTPPYLEMRDRVTEDGRHWVKEPVRSFFQTRLKDSNPQLSRLEKMIWLLRNKCRF